MKKIPFTIILSLMFVWSAQATFLPDEDIQYGMLKQGTPNIDEAQFNAIIQKAQGLYKDTVKGVGGNLTILGDWKSEKLNAGAQQVFGGWLVYMFGGLARRPELTPDGFTMIICHELGHHLAGFSFVSGGWLPFVGTWAANEGQSDYYASQVCARKFWRDEKEINATFRTKISTFALGQCDSVWSQRDDQDLCYRTVAAVESLATTMAALTGKNAPDFATPDTNVVKETNTKHPDVQCRMDTGLQGALCPAAFNDGLIPGKKTKGGVKGLNAEKEAARYSCTASGGYKVGLRPTCWFKPRL